MKQWYALYGLLCSYAQFRSMKYVWICVQTRAILFTNPDSKIHGATMGPTWDLSAPDGPHVGPMNLAIRESMLSNIYGYYRKHQKRRNERDGVEEFGNLAAHSSHQSLASKGRSMSTGEAERRASEDAGKEEPTRKRSATMLPSMAFLSPTEPNYHGKYRSIKYIQQLDLSLWWPLFRTNIHARHPCHWHSAMWWGDGLSPVVRHWYSAIGRGDGLLPVVRHWYSAIGRGDGLSPVVRHRYSAIGRGDGLSPVVRQWYSAIGRGDNLSPVVRQWYSAIGRGDGLSPAECHWYSAIDRGDELSPVVCHWNSVIVGAMACHLLCAIDTPPLVETMACHLLCAIDTPPLVGAMACHLLCASGTPPLVGRWLVTCCAPVVLRHW